MKYSYTVLILVVSMAFVGCQNGKPDASGDVAVVEAPVQENPLQGLQDQGDPALAAGEVKEYGRILAVEDGVYPMFLVVLEFPEKGTTLDFNLNIEAVDMDVEKLDELNGQYVTLYYKNVVENDLQAVLLNGENLLESSAEATYLEGLLEMEGVLGGAEEVTRSDLPATVSVRASSGEQKDFPLYVSPQLLEGNGKVVTVKYAEKSSKAITYIRLSAGV